MSGAEGAPTKKRIPPRQLTKQEQEQALKDAWAFQKAAGRENVTFEEDESLYDVTELRVEPEHTLLIGRDMEETELSELHPFFLNPILLNRASVTSMYRTRYEEREQQNEDGTVKKVFVSDRFLVNDIAGVRTRIACDEFLMFIIQANGIRFPSIMHAFQAMRAANDYTRVVLSTDSDEITDRDAAELFSKTVSESVKQTPISFNENWERVVEETQVVLSPDIKKKVANFRRANWVGKKAWLIANHRAYLTSFYKVPPEVEMARWEFLYSLYVYETESHEKSYENALVKTWSGFRDVGTYEELEKVWNKVNLPSDRREKIDRRLVLWDSVVNSRFGGSFDEVIDYEEVNGKEVITDQYIDFTGNNYAGFALEYLRYEVLLYYQLRFSKVSESLSEKEKEAPGSTGEHKKRIRLSEYETNEYEETKGQVLDDEIEQLTGSIISADKKIDELTLKKQELEKSIAEYRIKIDNLKEKENSADAIRMVSAELKKATRERNNTTKSLRYHTESRNRFIILRNAKTDLKSNDPETVMRAKALIKEYEGESESEDENSEDVREEEQLEESEKDVIKNIIAEENQILVSDTQEREYIDGELTLARENLASARQTNSPQEEIADYIKELTRLQANNTKRRANRVRKITNATTLLNAYEDAQGDDPKKKAMAEVVIKDLETRFRELQAFKRRKQLEKGATKRDNQDDFIVRDDVIEYEPDYDPSKEIDVAYKESRQEKEKRMSDLSHAKIEAEKARREAEEYRKMLEQTKKELDSLKRKQEKSALSCLQEEQEKKRQRAAERESRPKRPYRIEDSEEE